MSLSLNSSLNMLLLFAFCWCVLSGPEQKQKVALAKQLNLRPRQVEVWFQNRRARLVLRDTHAQARPPHSS